MGVSKKMGLPSSEWTNAIEASMNSMANQATEAHYAQKQKIFGIPLSTRFFQQLPIFSKLKTSKYTKKSTAKSEQSAPYEI